MAVDFDSGLAGAKLSGYLLIEQSCDHEPHHLPFAWRERVKASAQYFNLRPLLARLAIALQRLLNGVEQVLIAEGLGQKLHCPGFHSLHSHRDIAVAGDEDDGNLHVSLSHPLLQIKTAEARQTHVKHQAAGHIWAFTAQELLSGVEGLDPQSDRPD